MEIHIDPHVELFKWGPAPLRYFYQSDFNLMMGGGVFEKKYPEYLWPPSLAFYIDHTILWVNEFDALRERGQAAFIDVFLNGREQSIRRDYQQMSDELARLERRIDDVAVVKIDDADLMKLWRELHRAIIGFITPGLIPELCNYGADRLLEDKLKSHLGASVDSIPTLMEILTAPEEVSFYQEEEMRLVETDDIASHQRQYYWIGNSYSQVEVLPQSFFIERKEGLLPGLREKSRLRIVEVRRNKHDVQGKYSLSEEIMSIGKAIELSVLWQDNRKENILRYLHYKNMLLDEVIRRKGWRKDDLLNFSFEEIAEMFSGTDYAAAIEERKKGFAEYITNTRTLLNSDESRRYLALYSNQEAAGDEREISGIVASKGIAMGRVRILLDPHQSDRLSPGEVLVAPMTSPEYIFAMRRAVAIVTDSGGLTSHAAIVSRELEVPCIVGTKIATQVLHDGDLVEVDADNGVVRVIERVSDALYNKDTHWTHYLTRPFTLFGASLWQEWYNSPETHKVMGSQMKNALFIEQVPGVARNYRKYDELEDHKRCVKTLCEQNAQKVKAFLEEGVLLNREAKKYLSGEMKFVDIASAMDFLICLSLRATILPYWVIAFSEEITYQDTQLLTLAENIRSVSLYPNLVSQVIIPLAEEELRARGFDPSVLPYMTLQELLSGADDVASQRMSLSHRRKFFVYQILNGAENVSFVSDPAAVIATLEHVDDHDGVRGQAAFQGNVKGIARIVYSIVEKKEFNMGDILVSINSNPSLLPLIQKCGAIITDEGGIMCHAAIVARELKKPCIIGTKIATQVLHDGDLVEVDADQGVVRVIEKAEGTQAVSAKG